MQVIIKTNFFSDNHTNLLIEQVYRKANPINLISEYLFKTNKIEAINKTLWGNIVKIIFKKFSNHHFIAGVTHLYGVSKSNFFPITKNDRSFYKEETNKYVFTINDIAEIVTLTDQYCEDYSLNYFIFNNEKKIDYQSYMNFPYNSDTKFKELVLNTEVSISFGVNAEYIGIIYNNKYDDFIKTEILTLFN